jgi:flavin reductase (DIM6/NTAB) family NADH-FMN oxidoreductase RutF
MVDKIDLSFQQAMLALPPAPIVLVAVGGEEEMNVATVGMFNVFSLYPIRIGVGVMTSRYSYKLLKQNKDFSINIPGKEMMDKVEAVGRSSGAKVNKFEEFDLTPVKGKRIGSPMIKECLLNIECKKVDDFEVGDHTWFIAEIVHADANTDYDRSQALLYWDGEYRMAGEPINVVDKR